MFPGVASRLQGEVKTCKPYLLPGVSRFAFFCYFCRNFANLTDGVMVALQILVLPVQVRILVGQHWVNKGPLYLRKMRGLVHSGFLQSMVLKYSDKYLLGPGWRKG